MYGYIDYEHTTVQFPLKSNTIQIISSRMRMVNQTSGHEDSGNESRASGTRLCNVHGIKLYTLMKKYKLDRGFLNCGTRTPMGP